MQCNIDAKGKAVRMVSGLIVTGLGAVLLLLAVFGVLNETWAWIAAGALLALGGFQIFEARAGWCIVRAMGIKTRI